MLLWHDALQYTSATHLQARYPVATGIFPGFPHASSGRTAVGASNGQLTLPVGASGAVGGSTVTVGLQLTITSLSAATAFLEARFSSLAQVRVSLIPDGSKVRFQFDDPGAGLRLMRSSAVSLSGGVFGGWFGGWSAGGWASTSGRGPVAVGRRRGDRVLRPRPRR